MIEQGDGSMARLISDGLCPRCQTSIVHFPPVEVHGHIQCATCKLVISECCQGETSQNTIKEEENELD